MACWPLAAATKRAQCCECGSAGGQGSLWSRWGPRRNTHSFVRISRRRVPQQMWNALFGSPGRERPRTNIARSWPLGSEAGMLWRVRQRVPRGGQYEVQFRRKSQHHCYRSIAVSASTTDERKALFGMAQEAKDLAHRGVKPDHGGNLRRWSSVAAAWGGPPSRSLAARVIVVGKTLYCGLGLVVQGGLMSIALCLPVARKVAQKGDLLLVISSVG